jgi:hypothetical protein
VAPKTAGFPTTGRLCQSPRRRNAKSVFRRNRHGCNKLGTRQPVLCTRLASLSWITGRLREDKRVQPGLRQDVPADQAAAEHPLAFFKSGKYWGMILVFSAAILSVVAATPRAPPMLAVRARAQPAVVAAVTNVVTVTNETPTVSFPPMTLRGIVLNGSKSAAVINGQVLYIGEGFSNVVLVAVDADHATVELKGQTKTLTLGR